MRLGEQSWPSSEGSLAELRGERPQHSEPLGVMSDVVQQERVAADTLHDLEGTAKMGGIEVMKEHTRQPASTGGPVAVELVETGHSISDSLR